MIRRLPSINLVYYNLGSIDIYHFQLLEWFVGVSPLAHNSCTLQMLEPPLRCNSVNNDTNKSSYKRIFVYVLQLKIVAKRAFINLIRNPQTSILQVSQSRNCFVYVFSYN